MDSDDEMMAAHLLEEEEAIASEEDENIAILTCLLQLQADEEANAAPKRGGSSFRRKKTKPSQRMEGHCMLVSNYFAEVPVATAKDFRRRFRMNHGLFNKIVQAVRLYDPWFKLKKDVVEMVGFSSLQKCTVAMRMIAYGAPADVVDDYLWMSESTIIKSMYRFCRAVIGVFCPKLFERAK